MKHWDEVNIGQFSGPLDLLVTMIKDKKINIMDINLIDLADQYINYINIQKDLQIEIASEYLSMSAYLIELKSKLLLPREEEVEEEENSYEYFLEQLTRYEQIKSVTDFFAKKQEEYIYTFSKNKSKMNFASASQIESQTNGETMVDPLEIDMEDFSQIFKKVMARHALQEFENQYVDFEEEQYNTIETEVVSPQEIAQMIINKMKTNKFKEWKLEELLESNLFNIKNLISTFLAVLDLVRHSFAKVNQYEEDLLIQFTKEVIEDETLLETMEVEEYE